MHKKTGWELRSFGIISNAMEAVTFYSQFLYGNRDGKRHSMIYLLSRTENVCKGNGQNLPFPERAWQAGKGTGFQ